MANWCSTFYAIEGGQDALEKIYDASINTLKKSESDGSYTWEGNILINLGYNEKELNGYDLRGFLYDSPLLENGVLRLQCEEAWTITNFKTLIEELFSDVVVYFMAEEPGCDYYVTNDESGKYFDERFYVDTCINGNCESGYFIDREDAYDYVYSLSGLKTDDEISEFNNNDEGDFIYVHEYEVV